MGLFLGLRPPEARSRVIDQILDRVEGVPGVEAAAIPIQFLPLSGTTCGTGFWLEGHAAVKDPARSSRPTAGSSAVATSRHGRSAPAREARSIDAIAPPHPVS